MADTKNPGNVARGLKATIHNANVSEEAKENAAQRLAQMGEEVPGDFSSGAQSGNDTYKPDSDDLSGSRMRGTRSSASKANDEGLFSPSEIETDLDYAQGESVGEDVQHGGETNRVLGGYKATLKNPRVSNQAKQHAQEMLDDAEI
ncbi:UPF0654 protein C22G7.11c [Psilocybe cubensis]|uniref:Conidiation-specific protein 6 n=2 Tax=Psilocybe cubensis TaxID=181762 RepID=A0A8H7YA63_PSICU|nr:UPF0654 protein C22G7.11c [Psilocybe cubensis]KAH9486269.1 UPF0654 protein C22G7.11c [Psilocybe cubensis]